MCRHQVNQEQAADQITAGKNRDFPGSALWSPINEAAAEKFILRFEQPKIDLRKRALENEDQTEEKAGDG